MFNYNYPSKMCVYIRYMSTMITIYIELHYIVQLQIADTIKWIFHQNHFIERDENNTVKLIEINSSTE